MKQLLVLFCMAVLPASVNAKVETIYADCKYVMGDNDTKNDARRMCFLEAKRALIDKVGAVVESESLVVDGKLTKDEIKSYSLAMLKVETVNEDIKNEGQAQIVALRVKTEIDAEEINKTILSLTKDAKAQKKMQDFNTRVADMETRLLKLQEQLRIVDVEKAIALRKERNVVFKEMSKLDEIVLKIRVVTEKATSNIKSGMTKEEVSMLAGHPRSKGCNGNSWNYGDVWVIFIDGVASCMTGNSYYVHYNRLTCGCPTDYIMKPLSDPFHEK